MLSSIRKAQAQIEHLKVRIFIDFLNKLKQKQRIDFGAVLRVTNAKMNYRIRDSFRIEKQIFCLCDVVF